MKGRLVWLGAAVLLLALLLLVGYQARQTPAYKGTWIWDTPTMITHQDEILSFSKEQGVTNIYLHVTRDQARPRDYADFIGAASQLDIQVEALAGDPSWGRREKRHHIEEVLDWVASYNLNVAEEERFAGIHWDIEPYLLPEWKTDQDQVLEEWLSNMDFVLKEGNLMSQLTNSVDLPFWIHQVEVPGYRDYDVGSWMLKRFDKVVLMDYRDTAQGEDGIIAHGLEMVKKATAMGKWKSLIIGVEMAPSDEGNKATFYEEGYEVMERELEITSKVMEKYDGFGGVAIHGFPHWMSSYTESE
ncbi:hypothetical protein [Ammoniphilus sp. YIM 78166]|uniref:hypothetical protein n=1 Tax=Ammoniphilus sp. YIM 78166 TaxID=1644106 RepID=UPI00106FBBC5|nr:hypothetical protein [Ammoniphilus sp. YIM 78166]